MSYSRAFLALQNLSFLTVCLCYEAFCSSLFAYIRATETAAIVRQMKQYKRDAPADIEVFEVPAIVLKTGGDADSGEKVPESPDRQILGSIKALLLFDPLGLEITRALTGLYAAPEDTIRDVIKRLTLSD